MEEINPEPIALYAAPSMDEIGRFNDDTQGWGISGYDLENEFP